MARTSAGSAKRRAVEGLTNSAAANGPL